MAVPQPRPLTEELVTVPEIAFIGGVKTGTVERWKVDQENRPRVLPVPDQYIGSTPVWRLKRIVAFFRDSNRPMVAVDEYRKARDAGKFRRRGQ
jgi:hypothetical protein